MLLCYCGLIENQTKYLTNRFFQSHLYTWIPSRVGSVKKPTRNLPQMYVYEFLEEEKKTFWTISGHETNYLVHRKNSRPKTRSEGTALT